MLLIITGPCLIIPEIIDHIPEMLSIEKSWIGSQRSTGWIVTDWLEAECQFIGPGTLYGGKASRVGCNLCSLKALSTLELSNHVKSTVHGFCSEIKV